MSDYYLQYIEAIDDSGKEVSEWEAQFIEDILKRRPQYLSEKQQGIVRRMAEKYLGEIIK